MNKLTVNDDEIRNFRRYLMYEAARALTLDPSALQVTLLVLPTGEILLYPIHDLKDEISEDQFFSKLKADGKTHILHVLTMWKNQQIEIPKYSVRKHLLELDEENAGACVLLQGEKGINGFRLSDLF
jgi:hypothetical protein